MKKKKSKNFQKQFNIFSKKKQQKGKNKNFDFVYFLNIFWMKKMVVKNRFHVFERLGIVRVWAPVRHKISRTQNIFLDRKWRVSNFKRAVLRAQSWVGHRYISTSGNRYTFILEWFRDPRTTFRTRQKRKIYYFPLGVFRSSVKI